MSGRLAAYPGVPGRGTTFSPKCPLERIKNGQKFQWFFLTSETINEGFSLEVSSFYFLNGKKFFTVVF